MAKSNDMDYEMDNSREERKRQKREKKQQKQQDRNQASNGHNQQKQYRQKEYQKDQSRKNSASNADQKTHKHNYDNDKEYKKQGYNAQQNAYAPLPPYCAGCNQIGHTPLQCTVQKAVQSIYSAIHCTLCDLKGHTKDQCNNPNVRKCRNCCSPGHSASECRLRGFTPAYRPPGGTQMNWKIPNWEGNNQPYAPQAHQVLVQQDGDGDVIMGDTAIVAIPTSNHKQPFSFKTVQLAKNKVQTTNATSQVSQQRSMEQIYAKIAQSRSLYSKFWANYMFAQWEDWFRERLPLSTLCAVQGRLRAGFQFFRDPDAMMALAYRLRPQCWTCGKFGYILDWTMRGLPADVDISTVEDAAHWGILVHFECSCAGNGYRYEPYVL